MVEHLFKAVFSFVERRQRLVLAALCVLMAACAVAATKIHYDNDLSGMLPSDPAIRRDLDLIRQSVFAGKVVLSFELAGANASLDDLVQYVDKVAARLPGPMVSAVIKGPKLAPGDLVTFVQSAPRLVGEERLAAFAKRTSSSVIDEDLKALRSRLISFQGMFIGGIVRVDPLGLFTPELSYLQQLAATFGRNVTFYNGHFATQDGRHLMLILETPVPVTDGTRSAALLDFLQTSLHDRPAFAKIDIISGHAHTAANETQIKSDISRTVTVATLAYLLVLICFFRDMRAAIFFLIPACSVLAALVCSGLVFGSVSAFVAAMASVIIGVSDDYGILVYTAIRTAGRRDVAAVMARPIILAAFFTTGIFMVFFFSGVAGYHQLAFLTIVSIWLCVGFVLLIFPHLVTTAPLKLPRTVGEGASDPQKDKIMILGWLVLVVIMCVGASRIQFNSDISTLDGVDPKVRAGEERFEEVWLGRQKQSIFVVTAPTLEAALTINQAVYKDSAAFSKQIASIAPFMRPSGDENKNIAAWHAFWLSGEGLALRDSLRAAAARQGFSPEAFAAFMTLTQRESFPTIDEVPFLKQMSERFVSSQKGSVRVLTFFPEESALMEHFDRLALKYPGTFVFSRAHFTQRFSASINQEAVRLAGCAIVFLGLVAAFFLRRMRLILLVLSAAVTSILAVLAVYGFWGKPLTAPALVALMIAVGLAIDYGVFLLYALQRKIDTGTAKAVSISAATTLTGGLSLMAAHHPALFAIGLALSVGLAVGWLCAQIILPALYRRYCSDIHEAVNE
ncbi:MAG: hypothetical protein HQL22_02665 [Candidatus Omnitrophica bacterium]|nr:hypothetical protein [Candidatus Omnitrophota bacterium]